MLDQPVRARLDPDGRQVVEVVIDRGYHPDAIVARAWIPLRLVFRRQDGDICTERVVFSSPHIDRRLAATGTTTIELPAQPPGEVRFTCGMGRYDSRLETPVRRALVLWICSLPLIALLAVLALDVTAAIAVAGAALIACVAGCLWASGRSSEPI
jgi:hypothetical protein